MDAGIATNDNLEAMRKEKQKYVCVSRTKLKDYEDSLADMTELTDNRGNKIEVKLIDPKDEPDKWLLVRSHLKKKKEQAMLTKFEQKYENELEKIKKAISSKRGVKKLELVWERVGRAKERCKTAHKRYEIKITQGLDKNKNAIATDMTWTKIDTATDNRSGVYFIRTNITDQTDRQIWEIYNTIREVESTFRCLKTDLSIRPIFHQKDKYSTAHIQLGLMAYQIVAAIRHRLKQNEINSDWSNIVRIMNTQKIATIQLQTKGKDLHIRKPSTPEKNAKKIFDIMGITKFLKKVTKRVVYH